MEDRIKLQITNKKNFESWNLLDKTLNIIKKEEEEYYLSKNIQERLKNIENNFARSLGYKLLPEETKISGIFRAFDLTSIENTKVLILGQDPYPGGDIIEKEFKYRADGLAFSFGNNAKEDDSLKNIFEKLREIKNIKLETRKLVQWAEQGVLLLNTSLTYGKIYDEKNIIRKLTKDENKIQKKIQEEHFKLWENSITTIISNLINYKKQKKEPLVIMLWGEKANLFSDFKNDEKDEEIYKDNILILRSSHPSNQGKNYCGFYENATTKLKVKKLTKIVPAFICPHNNHFVQCNKYLKEKINTVIDWSLT